MARSYAWLGHTGRGYTEVNAIAPHRSGWRTVVDYVTSPAGFAQFVQHYAHERLVLVGINPRPLVVTHRNGGLRSASNPEISESQNLLLDIDLDGDVTSERLTRLAHVLDAVADQLCRDGFQVPVRAMTGRGYHLLFAYPPIRVNDDPQIGERLRRFRAEFVERNPALYAMGARVDSTQDLRRMRRISPKPGQLAPSTFPDVPRVEDGRLRDYLLQLPVHPPMTTLGVIARPSRELPSWFTLLVERDTVIRNLWEGTGKPVGSDQSGSGYDYTLTRALVQRGHTEPNDLATILCLRPLGSVRQHNKTEAYVHHTIERARQY